LRNGQRGSGASRTFENAQATVHARLANPQKFGVQKYEVRALPEELVALYEAEKAAKVAAKTARKAAKAAKAKPVAPIVPEVPLLQTRASEFADALKLEDGGKQARAMLRDQVAEQIPEAIPRAQDSENAHRVRVFKFEEDPDAAASFGLLGSKREGLLSVGQSNLEYATRGLHQLAAGKELTLSEVSNIRALVHEELHGHSRSSIASYGRRVPAALEEIGTELLARDIVSKIVPPKQWPRIARDGDIRPALMEHIGSYDEEIGALMKTVQTAADVKPKEAQAIIMNAHRKASLSRSAPYTSGEEAVSEFVGALNVSDEARVRIMTALKNGVL
jgi:hypothetical protein